MNLSSSSEEEGFSSNDEDIANIIQSKKVIASSRRTDADGISNSNDSTDDADDDEDDDFLDVEWEDGNDDEECNYKEEVQSSISKSEENSTFLGRKFPTKGVTIHFNNKDKTEENSLNGRNKNEKTNENRKKRRRINKIPLSSNKSHHLLALLQDIQRAHLLTLMSRSMFQSSCIGTRYDDELLNALHSLIPLEFIDQCYRIQNNEKGVSIDQPIIPTMIHMEKFCNWFFTFMHNFEEPLTSTQNSSKYSSRSKRRRKNKAGNGLKKSPKRNLSYSDVKKESLSDNQSGKIILDSISKFQRRILRLLEHRSNDNYEQDYVDNWDEMIHETITPVEKVLILLGMIRSMGWRVRYINALDPIEKDLTVDHPLFSLGMKDAFLSILKSTESASSSSKKASSKKSSNKNSSQHINSNQNLDEAKPNEYPWIEVLTLTNELSSERKKSRWIHVDPNFKLIDKPTNVERCRGQQDAKMKGPKRILRNKGVKRPVSFVLAVEQSVGSDDATPLSMDTTLKQNNFSTLRLIDVTPRYSNKWSHTLRLRGATAKELAKNGGNCSNSWWTKTLRKANRYFGHKKSESKRQHSSTKQKADSVSFAVGHKNTGEEVLIIDDSSDDDAKIKRDSHGFSDVDENEYQEFMSSKKNERIPTSKAAFKNHPLYVIPSVLGNQEVLALDAKKRMCGMFKGEIVYKRSDVSTAMTEKKWLYNNRKVKKTEIPNPVKKVKARKKPAKKGFQTLASYGGSASQDQASILASAIANGDFEEADKTINKLYGVWQTDSWSPPFIGPNDDIPVNEYRNVELALLNPGLIHLELHRIAQVAKQLGIPYAPCLLGFEGHGGARTPTIRGIVVHEHNVELLQEAHTEFESQTVEIAFKQRQQAIYRRWKRLIVGITTKDRLEREYVNDE
mmetsp:Transcript_4866/g.6302  ORF Transcript_4866/g.6302 Transcript_4866/m.6302 type:complete len:903 (+) Transcript_4866:75-2783(+)